MKFSKWNISLFNPKDPLKEILHLRKIEKVKEFLDPSYDLISSDNAMAQLKTAAKRIRQAIVLKEKIGIFMDYDADGICGGAIIYKTLNDLGNEPCYLVPHRREGYGLSKNATRYFIKEKINLLITVDCGIKSVLEVANLNKQKIDTIVVDHHQLDEILPQSYAIVHPKILKKGKICSDLSGGGVAYMLCRELYNRNGREKWLLDLAAISSVADVVPLVEDNRTIVKYGMLVLNKTKNLGLRHLIEVANLKMGEIGCYEIGFMVAPRLNAAGRVSNPQDSFKLLITKDEGEAKKLAQKLNELNIKRQKLLENGQNEACEIVGTKGLFKKNLIIVRGQWNEGIVGLIASKLVEKFNRPAIVLTEIDEKIKGSARSIPQIDITKLISKSSDCLLSFGGHSQAAGLSLVKSKFKKFEKSILNYAQKINKNVFEKCLNIDALIESSQIKMQLADDLEKLEPYGAGNPKPIFAVEKIKVDSIRSIGRDQSHRKVTFIKSNHYHQAVLFNFAQGNWIIAKGDILDIAFCIDINRWNGNEKIDLILKDVKENE
ncbi:MAG: single-stranded-DNA-specific exonuclease RecJ [Candidatus Berkelbacteria bacterium]|nr:single-stranded-DNA-specific exonuclease RecJ [Candidatus Berkelbacteria bacterium]